MKIKEILKELQHYLSIRKTGKTTLLKKGINEYPYHHWIVVPTISYGKSITIPSNKLHNLVTLDDLQKVRGTHQAMIIEQEANLQIISMALDEIQRLETESNRTIRISNEIVDLTEMFQDDMHKLQHHIMDGLRIPFWNLAAQWKYRKRSIEFVDYLLSNGEKYTQKFKEIKSYYNFEINT
jgi:HAMP domain-containing protein